MQRWHSEKHIARRHQRDRVDLAGSDAGRQVRRAERQLGRFRKRHALDCGRARCFLCHGDKLLDRRTREQCLADLNMQEGIDELYGR
jgi:hypothetical protein